MYAPIHLFLLCMEKGPAGFWKGNLTKASTSPDCATIIHLKRHLGLGQDFISLCVTHSDYGQDQTDWNALGKSYTIQINYVLPIIRLFCTRDAARRQNVCRFRSKQIIFKTQIEEASVNINKWSRMDFSIHNQLIDLNVQMYKTKWHYSLLPSAIDR